MQRYYPRYLEKEIVQRLKSNPIVALLGPRQCGKSTLAEQVISGFPASIYLDLENPADLRKLDDPLLFFRANENNLICIDEIQRRPDLFPVLRSIVDRGKDNTRMLILGSASRDLIRQSSETLAGRISYLELTPFLAEEILREPASCELNRYWIRGGFPRSILAESDTVSFQWRLDFIRTYLERDIPMLGISIPSLSLRRLWTMCAHYNGQILNASRIGESLGISHHTVRHYLDILEQTFLIRLLPPLETNRKKRIVKSPKLYIRDTGLLHALLDIEKFNDLLGHPVLGSSWEGLVIDNAIALLPRHRASFYRTSSGTEIDLVLEKGKRRIAIECKASSAPDLPRGFWNALEDLKPDHTWVVAPIEDSYLIKEGVEVMGMSVLMDRLRELSES